MPARGSDPLLFETLDRMAPPPVAERAPDDLGPLQAQGFCNAVDLGKSLGVNRDLHIFHIL